MKRIFRSALLAGLLFVTASAFASGDIPANNAAKSSITGKVIDIKTGESLAGVVISIEGTGLQAYTDLDGNFTFKDIKPGKYNLILSLISYKNSLVENLKLDPDCKEVIDVKLESVR